jgi:hypothetical protein
VKHCLRCGLPETMALKHGCAGPGPCKFPPTLAVGDPVWVEAFGGRWPAKVMNLRPFVNDIQAVTMEFDGPRELRYAAAEAGWTGRSLDCLSHLVTPRSEGV